MIIQENYKSTTLENGIRVVTENLPHISSFSLGFWFNVGSQNESINNNGISHFTEHMLFKGTRKRSSKKISDDVEKLGGYLNAFTSKEHTCYYGRGICEHLPKVFDVLSDMAQNSLFREKDINKESGVILDEYFDILDSPEELIFDRFESNLFIGEPLHLPIIGTEKNIKSFSNNDFVDFTNKNYSTKNLVVAATGNVSHEEIVELVLKKLTSLPETKRREKRKHKPKYSENLFIKKDIQQTHVIIGRKTFGYNNSDRMKVNLLSNIIGDGSSSRLFNLLREKNGLTYQINSFLNSFKDASAFGVYFSTTSSQVEKAEKLVVKELDKIKKDGVTARELSRAKEYMKGNLIMHLEGTTNRMIRMAQSYLYFNRTKSIVETISKIDAVTLDEINSVAKELLIHEAFIEVKVGK